MPSITYIYVFCVQVLRGQTDDIYTEVQLKGTVTAIKNAMTAISRVATLKGVFKDTWYM